MEYKWDGIRGQIIQRNGEVYIWSRGEELVTERYPELAEMARQWPSGTVIDGEILACRDGEVLDFAVLQTRIGRKKAGATIQRKAPVAFMTYDLLERQGEDLRSAPLRERRAGLVEILAAAPHPRALLSPLLPDGLSWADLEERRQAAREVKAEGLMVKRLDSAYQVGRRRGDWWKWKADPFTVDAILLYAQPGHGRRANLYTDYTFAVWDGDQLVTFAKAYSGLTDAEIREVDRFIRRNTRERFGPVRSVEPQLVFELAFEGIQESKRHKCGLAVRFPRIHRWRQDKPVEEANTLADLRALLPS